MKQRKYTLPRHTNLAKQGSRVGAFLVDFAIFLAFTLALLFGCFQFIVKPALAPYKDELDQEQLNTHLRYKDENGRIVSLNGSTTVEEYSERIQYYYLSYLTGKVAEPGTGSRLAEEYIKDESGAEVKRSEYYTVAWYNKNILKISADPDNDENSLFTYVKTDGVYDLTKIGIPKDVSIVPVKEISTHFQLAYLEAYLNDFCELNYVIDLNNKVSFYYSLEFVLSATFGGIITYIVFPLIFKQGRTIGKKVFKLALASKDGYIFKDAQLLMRFMPLFVCLLAFLIPIWKDLALVLLIPLIIFLVSFALAMASPRRASLHDFTAGTIVVDDKTSIIFENEMEEEAYILKEDNLGGEETEKVESEGEEPELRYEK